jgi:hypothetical protein
MGMENFPKPAAVNKKEGSQSGYREAKESLVKYLQEKFGKPIGEISKPELKKGLEDIRAFKEEVLKAGDKGYERIQNVSGKIKEMSADDLNKFIEEELVHRIGI